MHTPGLITLSHHAATATITPTGAGIRHLSVDGCVVVPDYAAPTAPAHAGVVMFPWAGRIPEGLWRDGGTERSLPINDPTTPSAIHGLVADEPFHITSRTEDSVRLHYDLEPTAGYPFQLSLEVAYTLSADGVNITDTVTNNTAATAPFAIAHHPYFSPAGAQLSEVSVDLPAAGMMERTEKKIPVTTTLFERTGVSLSPACQDDTYLIDFTGRDTALTRLHTPAGVVEVWQGSSWPWLHIYSTDDYPAVLGPEPVVALEVHTAAPNSLNWPDQLIRLPAQTTWSADWGIRFIAAEDQERP